jgi:hypothetical protein
LSRHNALGEAGFIMSSRLALCVLIEDFVTLRLSNMGRRGAASLILWDVPSCSAVIRGGDAMITCVSARMWR